MIEPDEIVANFELLGDWEERYQYLIDLGNKLDGLSDAEKTDRNKVEGCNSNVWMTGGFGPAPDDVLALKMDSDAIIVKGLLALFLMIYNGLTRAQVLSLDAQGLFSRLGLMEHLSPTRQNGMHAMVGKLREMASRR